MWDNGAATFHRLIDGYPPSALKEVFSAALVATISAAILDSKNESFRMRDEVWTNGKSHFQSLKMRFSMKFPGSSGASTVINRTWDQLRDSMRISRLIGIRSTILLENSPGARGDSMYTDFLSELGTALLIGTDSSC